jgi:hypothetical protein
MLLTFKNWWAFYSASAREINWIGDCDVPTAKSVKSDYPLEGIS